MHAMVKQLGVAWVKIIDSLEQPDFHLESILVFAYMGVKPF